MIQIVHTQFLVLPGNAIDWKQYKLLGKFQREIILFKTKDIPPTGFICILSDCGSYKKFIKKNYDSFFSAYNCHFNNIFLLIGAFFLNEFYDPPFIFFLQCLSKKFKPFLIWFGHSNTSLKGCSFLLKLKTKCKSY